MIRAILFIGLAVGLLPDATLHSASPTPEQLQFFEKEIRPLLAEHCFECHSGRAKKLQAGLRLDSRAALMRGGDSGAAIQPGSPDDSLLIQAVRYEEYEMPPTGKLSDRQIALLEKWVSIGAPWPDGPAPPSIGDEPSFDWKQRKAEHWCWQPIQIPQPPALGARWALNPIDHFVFAQLEAAGLTPAADADRRSWIRRVYFDLIGLPPAPGQVQAFLADNAPNAYQRVVDQLLRSPHFGEKWARHWLDLVRYGETCGHEFDYALPQAYRYRDYLVRAFNRDVAYDQLIHEHIAGDLLDRPRLHPTERFNESIIGTGFWFLGEAIHAPTDVRADEADRIDNQIDVMSKTFLGLTVACARCHDHKFDPISTSDYYALAGFLQSSRRQDAMLDPHGKIETSYQQLADLQRQGTQLWRKHFAAAAGDRTRAVADAIKAMLQSDDDAATKSTHMFYVLRKLAQVPPRRFASGRDALLRELLSQREKAQQQLAGTRLFANFRSGIPDDWYVTGKAFCGIDDGVVAWQPYQEGESLARPGVAHSGLQGTQFQGVLRSPTFVLPGKQVHYRMKARLAQVRLIVDGYTMDIFNPLLFGDITLENVNTQGEFRWVSQHRDVYHYVGHRAHLEIIDHGDGFAAIEEIRFSDDSAPSEPPHPVNLQVLQGNPKSLDEVIDAYAQALTDTRDQSTEGTVTATTIDVINWLVNNDLLQVPAELGPIKAKISLLDQAVPAPMSVMALVDGDGEDEYVFIRGNHRNLGKVVPRRLLAALAGEQQPVPARGSGRLELAQRITHPGNPLTARVAVNRLWHHLFGKGIVATVDDFGKMGQLPSHPELLDWLADDFMREKHWSIKKSIRQIVLSRTYRMSSQPAASRALANVDPDNRLLHRAPIRRLTAEAIRDSLLALSGTLDRKMFGPSVPVHLTPFMEGRGRPRKGGPLDGDGRRSLYIEVRRNFLSPMMLAFDMPIPFNAMGRRSVSNVPAQSLILMNDPFVLQQARRWAKTLLEDTTLETDQQRIGHAFEMAFARLPSERQLQDCHQFVRGRGESRPDEDIWTDLCHMLINMKPFIFLN